ncbi:Mbov_0400 family ICE element protein [Mycoplasmopsis agalactiae]|uniref:Mbov_0400 family ICE element protein n=1 Tax=Mycoplasmopsis agalactiae TaxID=2110 RepID=UPI002F9440D3
MSRLLIGKVYKQRNKENKLPIAKSKFGDDIISHGVNRPYLIFYSDNKVYYLSAKSVSDKNRKATEDDKGNLILKTDLYGDDKEIAVDCFVINVMDRKLFESLYVEDSEWNNVQTSAAIYDKVMQKVYENINRIGYFEVAGFSETETLWKNNDEALKNKKVYEAIIKKYCEYYSKQLSDEITNNMNDLFFNSLERKYKNIIYESQKEKRGFTL